MDMDSGLDLGLDSDMDMDSGMDMIFGQAFLGHLKKHESIFAISYAKSHPSMLLLHPCYGRLFCHYLPVMRIKVQD